MFSFWGNKEDQESPSEIKVEKDDEILKQPVISSSVFDDEEDSRKNKRQIKNPGKFEELNRESKEIVGTDSAFDGLRCELTKHFSERFNTGSTLSLGSAQEPPTYFFNAFYFAGTAINNQPHGVFLNGRLGSDGSLSAKAGSLILPTTMLRLSAQTSNEPHSTQFSAELDHEGSDWFGQFKWINPGIYGISYHQFVTKRLSLGCDFHYKYKEAQAATTYGARYEADKWIGTFLTHQSSFAASYTHKINDRFGLSTELMYQATPNGYESMYSMGYQYMKKSGGSFKGHIDSSGKVFGLFEEFLTPIMKYTLSGELDHSKKSYKFGIGFGMQL